MKILLRPFWANSRACNIFINASERPFEGLASGLV
jgi:hypothetical protein